MVAGLVVFLLVLQGAVAVGSSKIHSPVGAKSASRSAVSQSDECNAGRYDDDSAQPGHKHGHAQCCVFCGARDFEGVTPILAAQIAAFVAPSPGMILSALRGDADGNPPLLGWASSWSSQAPPMFS